jgi:hypothetical protein
MKETIKNKKMKKINSILAGLLLIASVFFTQQTTAQAPRKMSYQSVIRNSSNVVVANTQVGIRISVSQGTASGTAVFVETQTATTNANGLVSIQIGMGSAITGTFAGINWAAGPYFIKTETDPAGGSNYSITGTQEMLSVPYALFAATAATSGVTDNNWTVISDDVVNDQSRDVIGKSSLGVGFDMVPGYSFGFNTIVMRENNTRILFEDTSIPGSGFAYKSWRLTANEQGAGGKNYFSIDNVTDNFVGLKVKDSGTLVVPTANAMFGIGTDNPATSIHAKFNNSPTLRLEQDASGGYPAHIWDLVGNESNMAIKDVTNDSSLPFRIRPNSPTNSFVMTNTGIGIGIFTPDPDAQLHVNGLLLARKTKIDSIYAASSNLPLRIMDRGIVTGFNTSAIGQYSSAMGANVTATGEGELYNSGNVKGLSFISTSDRRVKKNIQSFTGALDKVLQLQARTYTYNVEEYPRFKAEKDKPQIGFIAQEIEEVLPQLVTTDGDDEALKSVRYGQLTPVIVEAIKEQQQQIINLKKQLQAQQQQIDELLKLLKH